MKAKPIQLILALLATVTVNAREPKPPVDRRPPPQPLLAVLDSNHDQELSADEIDNSSNTLSDLDKNGDGTLTTKELLPRAPKKKKGSVNLPPPPVKRAPMLIAVLDLDEDGILSAEEIEEAPTSLLTLDKDEDGVISRKELNPRKPMEVSGDEL